MGAEFLAILRIDYDWGIIMVYAYFRRMEVWFWRGRILTSIFCTNRLCLNSSSFWLVATGNCQPTEHSWSTYQGTDAFPQNHKLKIQGCTLAPKVLWKNWLFYRLWVAGILLQSMRRGKKPAHEKRWQNVEWLFLSSYDLGGVLLSTKREIEQIMPPLLNSKRQPHVKETNW